MDKIKLNESQNDNDPEGLNVVKNAIRFVFISFLILTFIPLIFEILNV